jgi:hypothetical protein
MKIPTLSLALSELETDPPSLHFSDVSELQIEILQDEEVILKLKQLAKSPKPNPKMVRDFEPDATKFPKLLTLKDASLIVKPTLTDP